MKGSWPKVTGRIRFDFEADHAMPRIGKWCEIRHTHAYSVWFGWTHEIQPTAGFTHEYMKQRKEFADLVDRAQGKYLNDILPMQPSAEVLAIWFLCNTEPAYCDHVIVQAYDGYEVEVHRGMLRSEWSEFFAGRGPNPFVGGAFTLK